MIFAHANIFCFVSFPLDYRHQKEKEY